MNKEKNETDILSVFFSDETELFRTPAEPEMGDKVRVRIRVPRCEEKISVFLYVNGNSATEAKKAEKSENYDIYEAKFICESGTNLYHFEICLNGETYLYNKAGLLKKQENERIDSSFEFRFTSGFHIPLWAQGAVQYQIFPDRFFNGDPSNDVEDSEYSYNHRHIKSIKDWNYPPEIDDYRNFYGGDISGIIKKLDYLEDLGVEVIYLNPIFLSPSSHKYDTQDYEHIDPHFGVIEDDADLPLKDWEHHNGYARRYIKRTLSKNNLEKSDALFARLCGELHKRGMKIILDGVFNHCGSFHRWMDKEGIYREKPGYLPGAFQDVNSPYREFFHFTDEKPGFEAWWGVESLPKLCYEKSQRLCEEIFSVAQKWLKPPYSIDGWRLDVAADLGYSEEFNHKFWKEFRRRVKAVNPDAVIIAEHYGNPEKWLEGDEWDSVMNYDAFMEPVSFFLTGVDKHSDKKRDDLFRNGEAFFDTMKKNMARFQESSLLSAMNELSNHDHSRFLTRTNRTVGRLQSKGSAAASEGIDKAIFRQAVVIQMTWPGAPTVYYADEAGQVGWTDPDNRRTYPWGKEDTSLIDMHKALINLHKSHTCLRRGSIVKLGCGYGWIAYARFDKSDGVIVVCNNNDEEILASLDLTKAGIKSGDRLIKRFTTQNNGWEITNEKIADFDVKNFKITVSARTAVIIVKK